ncbi:HNH endonuclease signature motif containing protein [Arthrobacter sp. B6]|uniref:HNH endonuclease signature motif containing protein n=1 Tax=Arthrobacter sp. B6 TaxID=1570137 RepID=UPI0008303824|nr:HNH endonuclease signature motif containing protein [Arthrobacter sp. B6]
MEKTAAVAGLEALVASVAALADCARSGLGLGSEGADPLREQADACLDGLEETARVEAILAAWKVQFTAGYSTKSLALTAPATTPGEHTAQDMGVVADVACALTVSERSASALLAQSHELTSALPLTLEALEAGDLSWQHAKVMVDETASLDPASAKALEAHFLDPGAPNPARGCPAGELIPSRFRHKARTWRERHHPDSIEKRHTRSAQDRRLEYAPDRDGMAWLSAHLPADQAAGIWNRTTTAARALQGPAESRTLTQLRADIAATWLLTAGLESTTTGNPVTSAGGIPADRAAAATGPAGDVGAAGDCGVPGQVPGQVPGRVPSPAAQVLVTVPVFALMGLTDEPATLDGFGPIPASMARKLVAEGATSFHRVLTDPRDGAPLEIGRASYRIPPAMRQWLRLRDGKCPFPGCTNQSLDNEADHLLAWAEGGTTGITNLGQPCPKHHRLKHTTAWTPTKAGTNTPPGWTSPTGRHYPSEHQDWEPPQWPAQVLSELVPDKHP